MAALRRHKLAAFVLALLTFILLLRLAWGWYAARQLAAELEALRRREPATPLREIAIGPLPPSENAWSIYAQAIAALKPGVDSPRNSQLEYPPYPPHGPQWEQLAAASEQAHAAVFATARRARGLQRSQIAFIDFSGTRRLASTLADGAQHAHLRGDDAEALERLLDLLHLARSVRQDPAVLSQLLAIAVEAIASDAVQQTVPAAKLDGSANDTPATPAQFRALAAALLDERQTREWALAAVRQARATELDWLEQRALTTWAIRPLADRTAVRWVREFELVLEAGGHDHAGPARQLGRRAEAHRAAAPPYSIFPGPGDYENRIIPRYSRWFEEDHDPLTLTRFWEQNYRVSAERRATAMIVAARLYHHDHARWPDTAAALVPRYLDALPTDPFRADGAPLGYTLLRGALPDGGDRPMVYFDCGEGGEELIDSEPMYSWQQNRRPGMGHHATRQYRDVSYWLPKVRRFEEERKRLLEEQQRLQEEQKERNEQRQQMFNELYGLPEAVDGDPDKTDAPREDAEDQHGADGPPEQ